MLHKRAGAPAPAVGGGRAVRVCQTQAPSGRAFAGPLHIPYDVVAGSGYKRAARRAAVRFLGGYNARFWARGPRIWAGTNGRRAGVLSSSGYKSTQSLAGLPPNCNHTRVLGRVLHGTAAGFIENSA